MTAAYHLYVEDADASMRRALAYGAVLEMEVGDMPYGDRQGGVKDPHGSIWWISQRMVREPTDRRTAAPSLIPLTRDDGLPRARSAVSARVDHSRSST